MRRIDQITCPSELEERILAIAEELGLNNRTRGRWLTLLKLVDRLVHLPSPFDPGGCVCERCTGWDQLPLDDDPILDVVTPEE